MRYIITTIIFVFAILPLLGFRETTDSRIVAVLGIGLLLCGAYFLYKYLLQDEKKTAESQRADSNKIKIDNINEADQ